MWAVLNDLSVSVYHRQRFVVILVAILMASSAGKQTPITVFLCFDREICFVGLKDTSKSLREAGSFAEAGLATSN